VFGESSSGLTPEKIIPSGVYETLRTASGLQHFETVTDGQIVAIDGKTLRRSYDKKSGKSAIHMVSVWAM